METKVYEYNNIKYRVSASKDIHTRLNTDDAFAATFFQQRTTKHATFIGSTQSEDEPVAPPQDHQEYTSDASGFPKYKWTQEMTRLLISLYKDRKDKVMDPKVRRKSIFTEIAAAMKAEGHDVDLNDVDRKWRNMKSSFFTILSGNKGENTRWPYFNDLYPLFINEHEDSLPFSGDSEEGPSLLGVDSLELRPKPQIKKVKLTKEVNEPVSKGPSSKKHTLHKISRHRSKLTTNDQVLLKLKLIHRHKMNILKLQAKRNKYLKVISEEMKKSNEESKRKNELMRKFLNLYLSTCVFT